MAKPLSNKAGALASKAGSLAKSIRFTRSQLDKVFTLALMANSVLAAFSVVVFFLSSWWIFLLIGIFCFPLVIGAFLLYRYTKYGEPMRRFVFRYVVKIYEGFVQKRGILIRKGYTVLCWLVPSDEWKQVSWGYASNTARGELLPNLEGLDAEKRWYVQLYHYLATGMGNWSTLEGKNVIELRSGGGAGVEYISRTLNPNKVIGVDLSITQTKYNEENKEEEESRFYKADSLEEFSKTQGLQGKQFDLALSLQSSQYIRDFGQFIKEVDSVVKPGGIFAFADLRSTEDWPELEKQLQSSSLSILKKENISQNVINAFKYDELEKFGIINKRFGSYLKSILHRIGVVKNNAVAETLSSGSAEARAYLLHKVPIRNY